MREADLNLVHYFIDNHGPFHGQLFPRGIVDKNGLDTPCDFCRNPDDSPRLQLRSNKSSNAQKSPSLWACFACEALEWFLPGDELDAMKFELSAIDTGPPAYSKHDKRTADVQALVLRKSMDVNKFPYTGEECVSVVKLAHAYSMSGFDEGPIIPSILGQVDGGKNISQKQYAVLVRFNQLCTSKIEGTKPNDRIS